MGNYSYSRTCLFQSLVILSRRCFFRVHHWALSALQMEEDHLFDCNQVAVDEIDASVGELVLRIIAGFCRVGDMKRAWLLHKEMFLRGQPQNIATYTCLVDGFCKLKRMDMADLVISEMRQNNIMPYVVTYTALVAGYRRLGDFDRAYSVSGNEREWHFARLYCRHYTWARCYQRRGWLK